MSKKEFLQSVKYSEGVFKIIVGDNSCFARITDKSRPILVAFTNMGAAVSPEEFYSNLFIAWGDKIAFANGVNIISFGCIEEDNWYRNSELTSFISEIGKVINNFPERLGYGGSMGGGAAGSFAELLNLDRLLLLNPITTLNTDMVPWETRFQKYASLDWHSSLYDGSNFTTPGIVVYDPIFHLDKKHAERYEENVLHLKCPGVGHAMPKHLIRIGVLKQLFAHFVNNKVEPHWFHKQVRRRKLYPHYYRWLLSSENIHKTPKRETIITKHQRALEGYLDESVNDSSENLVPLLKEAAFALESVDIKLSLRLLSKILEIHPRARVVQDKYNSLQEIHENQKDN